MVGTCKASRKQEAVNSRVLLLVQPRIHPRIHPRRARAAARAGPVAQDRIRGPAAHEANAGWKKASRESRTSEVVPHVRSRTRARSRDKSRRSRGADERRDNLHGRSPALRRPR